MQECKNFNFDFVINYPKALISMTIKLLSITMILRNIFIYFEMSKNQNLKRYKVI